LETNTLLVFTSDHGDMLGSHGGRNKQQPYDESIRVPLLFRWPAGLTGPARRLDAVVNSEDLMPTLLGLMGMAVPKSVEGLDFSGYLLGGVDPSDGATLISCVAPFGQWPRMAGGREYRGIRTKQFTYVRSLRQPWMLFDNDADPFQLHNLAGNPKHVRLQAQMDTLLKHKLRETKDSFRPAAYYIRRFGYTVDATGTVPYQP
jgi:arylsulfatase A-like enzyme